MIDVSSAPPPANATPARGAFYDDVVEGLSRPQKWLPSKYLYDAHGSKLFDEITALPEYYPTRTEVAIMEAHIGEMVARIGPRALLIEYGSGSSTKTRLLLDRLKDPAGYVPIDISRSHLLQSAMELAAAYPDLHIYPLNSDYTAPVTLPTPERRPARTVVFFPGSTIGNFDPEEAAGFLQRIAGIVGAGGGLLIGVDLRKDPARLEAAYDDARGVTAAFNLNLLTRINRELGGTFDPSLFEHRAVYDEEVGRVEMHLVSRERQTVRVADRTYSFRQGEYVHTENSYKYAPEQFAALAASAGFVVDEVWTDPEGLFSLQYLTVGRP